MGLDIRLPIGLLFGAVGALLAGYGALSSKTIYHRSLGLNVNLVWGTVLLLFGITMFILGYRGAKARRPDEASSRSPAERIRKRDA
jgi:hypothetical protein